jgi:hypothetical protein
MRRYMSHLSEDALTKRATDISFNLIARTPSDALVDAPRLRWDYLWRDVVDEAHRRYGDARGQSFLEGVWARCVAMWRARWSMPRHLARDFIRRGSVHSRPFLVRYGKRGRLADLVSHGKVRISPATSYSDPSLNPAIRDDELELQLQPNPSEFRVEVRDQLTGQPKGRIRVIGDVITSKSDVNYYVYCMSIVLSPGLLTDFGADACVIITRPEKFFDRLLAGVTSRLPDPRWVSGVNPVQYVDPLNTRINQFHVPVAKHFRYAYQGEWRMVWCPLDRATGLIALDVEVGNMDDCCQLLCP